MGGSHVERIIERNDTNMSKPNREEAAQGGIILDMDKPRNIRWTFAAIKLITKRGMDILRRETVSQPGQSYNAGQILASFLKMPDILEAAVAAATGTSYLEGKEGTASEAAVAIQAYLDRGGDIEALSKELFRAYITVADPSSLPAWEANLVREEETRRLNAEKADLKLAETKKELAKMKAPKEEASGKNPTA